MVEDADVELDSGQERPADDGSNVNELEVSRLKMKLEEALRLAGDRLDQLQRCRADMDNVMKRAAKEKEENAKYASEKLMCRLLPILDSLEQAAKHDEGSKVLYLQLFDILMAEGLMPIDAAGKKFDPYRHEALFQVKTEELEEGIVAEEVQKGYLCNSRVIRTSKVAVAKR